MLVKVEDVLRFFLKTRIFPLLCIFVGASLTYSQMLSNSCSAPGVYLLDSKISCRCRADEAIDAMARIEHSSGLGMMQLHKRP